MSRKSYWLFVAVILLTVPFISAKTSAALEVLPLHGRVNDLAGILSPTDTSDLNQKLAAIETETTNQIAILIIPSLNGDSIEEFGIRVARIWALGQKTRNNGVLILMSVQDRAVRIEVGYGLEGALTDAQSSYIIRNIMVPAFRQQQYAEGLSRAVDAIAAAIAGEFKAEPKTSDTEPKRYWDTVIFLSILLLIFFSIVLFLLGPPSRGEPTYWSGGSRGRDFGGWGGLGGGGFSGGGGSSGGGFSGGGGSFGGGGASGRW